MSVCDVYAFRPDAGGNHRTAQGHGFQYLQTLAVVPLRAGGGSRLKILEAMALGRPVVSTRVGAEGIDVTDGHDILLADDADAFAAAISRLLEERDLWRSIVSNARRFVEERHDWDLIAEQQLGIYDAILDNHQR